MGLPKIAIVEFDESHVECIHSQILFLKEDYDITLLVNEKSIHSIPNSPYITKIPLALNHKKEIKETSKWLKSYLIQKQIKKVILNSGERKIYKFLKQFLFNQEISFWGLLHNPPRLKTSLKQKLISKKLKGYFVLSDFIKKNIQQNNLTKTPIENTYLIYFHKKEFNKSAIQKPNSETWILIPGRVEAARRDYSFLLHLGALPKNIKFIILGNINTTEGLQFKEQLIKTTYQNQFITFDSHIPDDNFSEYLSLADFVLPLVHPNNQLFEKYLHYKITASYNWSYSYKKTMLLEKSFSVNSEFHETSYFYDLDNISSFFDILKNPKKEYLDTKWSFEYQKNRYLNFIETTS